MSRIEFDDTDTLQAWAAGIIRRRREGSVEAVDAVVYEVTSLGVESNGDQQRDGVYLAATLALSAAVHRRILVRTGQWESDGDDESDDDGEPN